MLGVDRRARKASARLASFSVRSGGRREPILTLPLEGDAIGPREAEAAADGDRFDPGGRVARSGPASGESRERMRVGASWNLQERVVEALRSRRKP